MLCIQSTISILKITDTIFSFGHLTCDKSMSSSDRGVHSSYAFKLILLPEVCCKENAIFKPKKEPQSPTL